MAFKIPLPVVRKQTTSACAVKTFGLPLFNRHDLKDITMIGMGSFGKVYRATNAGQLVVMKEMLNGSASDRYKRLFNKEIELLALVRGHDNIVNINAFSDNAILLQYAEFSFTPLGIEHDAVFNLKELLHSCDQLTDFDGFQHLQHFICVDIVAGLAFLHQKGIVHRDFKPDNVLICNRHYSELCYEQVSSWWNTKPVVAKLTDFGESRSALTATKTVVCTHTSELYRGSPAYMAPEALLETATTASISQLMCMDIWSLGMTLFHLINPDISFPYSAEVNSQSDMSAVDVLKKCVAEHVLADHVT
jgi:serine/threonine protein kinase